MENPTRTRFQIGSHESDIHIHSATDRDSNPEQNSEPVATGANEPRHFNFSDVNISVVVLPHTPEGLDGQAFISLRNDSDIEIML